MHFNGPNLTILMQKVNWWAKLMVISDIGGIDLQCLSPFCWHTCCPTVNWSQYVRLYDNHFNRKIPAIWLKHGRGRLFWKIWIWSFFFRRMSNWIDLQLIMELWIWWCSLWHLFFWGSVLWWAVTWASCFDREIIGTAVLQLTFISFESYQHGFKPNLLGHPAK